MPFRKIFRGIPKFFESFDFFGQNQKTVLFFSIVRVALNNLKNFILNYLCLSLTYRVLISGMKLNFCSLVKSGKT